jgi:hypothetical protein
MTTTKNTERLDALTPVSCEYTQGNLINVGLRTKDGRLVHATMSPTALLNLVSMAVKLVNSNTARIMAEVVASDAELVAAAG